MSTRHAKNGSGFSQERYASAAQTGALLGNLVAKKCEATPSGKHRRLLLFLHDLTLRAGCSSHPTCNQFPSWPWPTDVSDEATAFERIACDLAAIFPRELCKKQTAALLPDFLTRLCLDPKFKVEQATMTGCPGIVGLLEEYRAKFCAPARSRVALTEPTQIIWEALDYALQQRGLVLVEGTWRVGKSYSAQAWVLSHLGECRYCSLSSSRDDTAFYRDLARALGVACSTVRKASEIRTRIESMLRTQSLLLILDEAQFIWPQSLRPQAPPERVNWLISALLNNGVAVALIASHDFSRLLRNVELKCPVFGSEQFHGRLRLRKTLPDTLGQDDLFKIARSIMPESTEPMQMLLVGNALKSKGRISAIESIATRARFFAGQETRPVCFDDLEKAIAEQSVERSSRTGGGKAASPSREDREKVATTVAADRTVSSFTRLAEWPGMFAGERSG